MKCALVWRNGYAELRVTQCNADEFEYLKKQIGKSVEVEIRPTQYALDAAGTLPVFSIIHAAKIYRSLWLVLASRK